MFRLTLQLLLIAGLVGCISAPPSEAEWPGDLPPRSLYETAWTQDPSNQMVQSLDSYLRWVLRFYQGWPVYDYGWLELTRDVLVSIENPVARELLASRLVELGRVISIEWSKDSSDRYIRTPTISIWGDALREAVNRDDVQALTNKIFRDIDQLASRQLDLKNVTLKRYYDIEEEDFF